MKERVKRTKIFFLGLNHDQLPYLKVLKKLKFYIVGADINPSAPGVKFCNKYFQIGYDEPNSLIKAGNASGFSSKDKIFTAAAQFAHLGAALFAKHFDINYPSRSSIEICLDKVRFYQSFSDNNLPIPKTYIVQNETELKRQLNKFKTHSFYYLKSDFSKNPNYVYRFNLDNVPWNDFCWEKDRYFRNHYVLQEEYPGVSLRINIYGDRFNVFDFETNLITYAYHETIKKLDIISLLKDFRNFHGMDNWLLKFDVILADDSYVVLDVGMEPPMRMRNHSIAVGVDFEKHYIDQYVNNIISYPNTLD